MIQSWSHVYYNNNNGNLKPPTLRLKVLNKHSIIHIMYVEMDMLSAIKMYIRKKKEKLTHNVDGGSTMQKMHTYTVQTDRGDGQCCLAEIFREMSSVCFWRKREYSCAWPLGGDCSRCGGQSVEKCESHGFCGWSVGIWACMSDEEQREWEGL